MSAERTLVLLKPDAMARGLAGELLSRFLRCGLTPEAIELRRPDATLIGAHYAADEGWLKSVGEKTQVSFEKLGLDCEAAFGSKDPMAIGHTVRGWLIHYMTSGQVLAIVFSGTKAVTAVRKLIGATFPNDAAPGTIRGDYSLDTAELAMREGRSVRNLVHASGSVTEAEAEIALWFPKLSA